MADEAQAKPTLETLLERINELRDEMRHGFSEMRERFAELDKRVSSFQKEMSLELRVIHDDVRRTRVKQEDLDDRVSALEHRPA